MLRSFVPFCLLIFQLAHARITNLSITCPSDWSLDPKEKVIRCMAPEAVTPVKCQISSCYNYPIGAQCTNVSTQEKKDAVICKNGFNVIQQEDGLSYTRCIDEQDAHFSCKDDNHVTLSCASCAFETTPFRVQFQKRAMLNSGGVPMTSQNGFGGDALNW